VINLNIEAFINYLTNKGFDDKQINQLVKIQESGYDLIEFYDDNDIVKPIEENYIKNTDGINELRKLRNILVENRFNNNQFSEILKGHSCNIKYEKYSDLKYNADQMLEIRMGLKINIDIEKYSKESYSWEQMEQIRLGLCDRVDVTKYNDIKYNCEQMEVLKEILLYNKKYPKKSIDISLFQNEKITSDEMNFFFELLKINIPSFKNEIYDELNKYNSINFNDNDINEDYER
jgi:hypothetical protein